MYINVFKASPYSYTERNFKTLEEAKSYLNVTETINFKTWECTGELIAKVNGWTIMVKEGLMPNQGEGYVDMTEESGVLADCY